MKTAIRTKKTAHITDATESDFHFRVREEKFRAAYDSAQKQSRRFALDTLTAALNQSIHFFAHPRNKKLREQSRRHVVTLSAAMTALIAQWEV